MRSLFVLLTAGLWLPTILSATGTILVQQEATLKANAPGNGNFAENLGQAVAVSGNYAVVGSERSDFNVQGIQRIGRAFIYERDPVSGEWSNVQGEVIAPFSPQLDERFADAVAISGNTIAIGTPGDDGSLGGINPAHNDNRTDSGAVYILELNEETGEFEITNFIKAPAPQSGAEFGRSVAIDGNILVVGEPLRSFGQLTLGAIYIYERDPNTGVWQTPQGLTSGSPSALEFGLDVAVSGGVIVASLPEEGFGGASAHVITKDLNTQTWGIEQNLRPAGIVASDTVASVAVSGKVVALGSPREDGSGTGVNPSIDNERGAAGAVWVFSFDGIEWVEEAYLKASNPSIGDQMGISVALSGNYLATGAPAEDGDGTGLNPDSMGLNLNSGAAYLYERDPNTGDWSFFGYLKVEDTPGFSDEAGRAIALDGNTLILGATREDGTGGGVNPPHNDSGTDEGAAYAFRFLVDSDSDGFADDFELFLFGDLDETPGSDFDGDTLTNETELEITLTDPTNPDTDGDCFPDGIELQIGLDPLVSDLVLFQTVVEVIANDPAKQQEIGLFTEKSFGNIFIDAPLVAVDTDAGEVTIEINLEVSDTLEADSWQPFGEPILIVDPNVENRAFYRIFLEEKPFD